MIALRIFLYAVIGLAAFALLGHWGHSLMYSRLARTPEIAFFIFGAAGAVVGAIVGATLALAEELRKSKSPPADQH